MKIEYSLNSTVYKINIFVVLTTFLIFLSAVNAQSVMQFYVREGAVGKNNGSTWGDAYTNLPTSLVRGSVYFIADGQYGPYTFDDVESGSSLITIKKANSNDHGTDIGWVPSYGDGQAIWSDLIFSVGFYVFDGNMSEGYGFSIIPSTTSYRGIWIKGASSVNYITVRSVSINCNNAGANARGLQSQNASNIKIINVETYGSENDCFAMNTMSSSVIERFYCHSRRFGSGIHGDAFEIWGCSDIILKNSTIDWDGQQIFWGGGFTNGRWDIFGNVFCGGKTSGKGLHPHSTDPLVGPIYVYNNSFSDLAIAMDMRANQSGQIRNNIFVSIGSSITWGNVEHSYNYFENNISSAGDTNPEIGNDPFVSRSSNNWSLLKATKPGDNNVGLLYSIDPKGKARGNDGNWDRGAFEYQAGGLVAPANLKIRP